MNLCAFDTEKHIYLFINIINSRTNVIDSETFQHDLSNLSIRSGIGIKPAKKIDYRSKDVKNVNMLHLALLQDFDKSNNNEMEFEISEYKYIYICIYIYIPQVTEFQAENTFLYIYIYSPSNRISS